MDFLTENKKEIITEFVKFVKSELGIKKCPTVVLQNGKGGLNTTAAYDYSKENKIVKINAKNRALVDVLRSIAHEMVHHKQWEDGRLDGPKPPDIGGEIEDEANAKAGQFIKMFAKDNKSIYEE